MAIQELCTVTRVRKVSGDVRTNRDFRKANQHMHEFLAVLGHELRSPLAAIRNALRLLDVQDDNPAKRKWARSIMERQTQSINRIVEDLLDFSRMEHGNIQLSKHPLDLCQSVARAVETTRCAVEARGHFLEVLLPQEPMTVNADAGRLEQVLINLINNAAKYMEPGGHVWVTIERQNGDIALRVRDSGVGIAADMLEHVFDPFWQLEGSLNQSQGGLGIGLALVRKLAELHGGSVSAYSAGLGRGSEFVVRLPAFAEMEENVYYRTSEQHACASLM